LASYRTTLMNKTRASEELLGQLHEAVTTDLLRRVKAGDASPAELNAAIKLLQNNGIEAILTEESPLKALMESLPKFEDEGEYAN